MTRNSPTQLASADTARADHTLKSWQAPAPSTLAPGPAVSLPILSVGTFRGSLDLIVDCKPQTPII